MKLLRQRDFWAGMMFLAFGLFFFVVGQNYRLGVASKMGPAYFPVLLSLLMSAIGIAVAARAAFTAELRVHAFVVRPIAILFVSVCLFGVLLRPLGLVISTMILVVVGSFAGPDVRWKESIAAAAVLTVFSVLIFVYALGLPFPLWPDF